MKKTIVWSLLSGVILLSGCATPVGSAFTGELTIPAKASLDYSYIDPQNVNWAVYEKDHRECAALANQTDIMDNTTRSAAQGALLGLGAGVVAAGLGSSSIGGTVIREVAVGMGLGIGASTYLHSKTEQDQAFRLCLKNRGYAVIR